MSETEEPTIADSQVLSKYKSAGDIVNRVLKKLVAACVDGASVRALCMEGDKLLLEELGKVYKKEKDITKGLAFPTCVSVNNCINHYSPLQSEDDLLIKTGDLVKLDFGAHIDGFIAVLAHSLVVGATAQNKVTGRQADVMLAAHYCAEAALRLLQPGNENLSISSAVAKVADVFSCNPVEGMLSFQLQQNRIDGEKMIQQTTLASQRKDIDRTVVEPHEVYAMDVVISSGKGQGKEMDSRVTIYKKTDEVYSLKLKCSKEFFRKVSREHATMPFTLRDFEDEKKARMGVMECVTHKLVAPYPVLWERQGEFVAQFKYTVLVTPTGPQKITGVPFDLGLYDSQYKLSKNKEALAFVEAPLNPNKKKNKKKPASTPEATGAGKGGDAPSS